jgi:hypothetical protein
MLAKLSPEEIRAGLDACVGRTYPPNPSEFHGMAKAATKAIPAAHQPYKRLPRPAPDPGVASQRFATVRAALQGAARVG